MGPWSTTDHLLTLIAELVDRNTRAVIGVAPLKRRPSMRPLRIPRPDRHSRPTSSGTDSGPPTVSSPAQIRAFFGGHVHYSPKRRPNVGT